MEAQVTCLIVAALLLHLGSDADAAENTTVSKPIECYFCYEATEVQNCNQVKTCGPGITGCRTVVLGSNTGYPFVDGTVKVTRDCAQTCFSSDPDELGQETQTICCTGNLCNQLFELLNGQSDNSSSSAPQLSAWSHGLLMGISLLGIITITWVINHQE